MIIEKTFFFQFCFKIKTNLHKEINRKLSLVIDYASHYSVLPFSRERSNRLRFHCKGK